MVGGLRLLRRQSTPSATPRRRAIPPRTAPTTAPIGVREDGGWEGPSELFVEVGALEDMGWEELSLRCADEVDVPVEPADADVLCDKD